MVDDERASLEILLRCLRQKGHTGVGADSAEEAARALAAGAFDLVLLDHVLPGQTGMQAIPRLRALTRAPIHIMSGYSDDETRRDAVLLGASGFIPKPIEFEAVSSLLESLPERPA